jgi:hypothetical protein
VYPLNLGVCYTILAVHVRGKSKEYGKYIVKSNFSPEDGDSSTCPSFVPSLPDIVVG